MSLVQGTPVVTLNRGNHVSLIGEVNKLSVDKIIDDLHTITHKNVYLYIDSPGGYVVEGERLVSNILYNQASGKEIICIAENAHSMAFYIFQNCKHRWVTPSAKMMQHQVSLQHQGPLINQENYLRMVNQMSSKLHRVCAERIGMPENTFLEKVRNDWWLFGQDIVNNNVADSIVLVGCNNTVEYQLDTIKHKVSTLRHPCPITQSPPIPSSKKNYEDDTSVPQDFISVYF